MLSHKLIGAGFGGLPLAAFQDVETGITATGTNQATAYSCTAWKSSFSTVASGTGAVLSPNAGAGDSQIIYNGGANVLKIYPPSGANFHNLAANAGILLPTNTAIELHCMSLTFWFGVLSR